MNAEEPDTTLHELGAALRADREAGPDAVPVEEHAVQRVLFRLSREKLLPRTKPKPWRRALTFAAPLAVAAALLFWFARPAPDVQAFALEVHNPAALRGAAAPAEDVVVRGAAGRATLVLRPTTASTQRHGARVFARGPGAGLRSLDVTVESAESGAIRILFDRALLGDARELVLVLGPEGGLGDGRAAAEGDRDRGPRFLRRIIAVVD